MTKRCWSNLPLELLESIEDEIVLSTEKLRFSCVCKTWQFVVEVRNYDGLPWLLVPNYKSNKISLSYGLHNLLNNKVYGIDLEEAKGKLLRSSSHGWIVMIDSKSPMINLINLITTAQVQLPSRNKFPDVISYDPNQDEEYTFWDDRRQQFTTATSSHIHYQWLHKIVLSSSPTFDDSIAASIYGEFSRLAFCRKGDKKWITIDDTRYYEDLLFHKDQLYAFVDSLCLNIFNISSTAWPPKLIESIPFPKCLRTYFYTYLVEHSGQILMVLRLYKWVDAREREMTRCFNVYKLHRSEKSWSQLSDIEGGLLFLGLNTSISVSSSDLPAGCKGNRIYFSDHLFDVIEEGGRGGYDFGIYDMIDKEVYRFEDYISDLKIWPPPIWVTLNSS